MSTKMGRPKLGKATAKSILIGARFSPQDAKAVENAAAHSKQDKSKWLRSAAVNEAQKPPIWLESKWTKANLDGKFVEFRLKAPTYVVSGIGKFWIRENPTGQIAIDILVFEPKGFTQIVETRYYLFPKTADMIERHPDPKVAAFRLLA